MLLFEKIFESLSYFPRIIDGSLYYLNIRWTIYILFWGRIRMKMKMYLLLLIDMSATDRFLFFSFHPFILNER